MAITNKVIETVEEGFTLLPVEKIKNGEFVRRPGKKRVYIRQEYDRELKKYLLQAWDDINHWSYVKKGTMLETDFIF